MSRTLIGLHPIQKACLFYAEENSHSPATSREETSGIAGGAVGPFWRQIFENATSSISEGSSHLTSSRKSICLNIAYHTTVARISSEKSSANGSWDVLVHSTNAQTYRADVVVNATGVEPRTQWLQDCGDLRLHEEDGGIVVDPYMQVRSSTIGCIRLFWYSKDICVQSIERRISLALEAGKNLDSSFKHIQRRRLLSC